MRFAFVLVSLALLLPGLAQASGATSLLAAHNGAVSTPAQPAKPAPTIIPGSPLAALTGATKPADQDDVQTPKAPFGTQTIGFAVSTALGKGTLQAFQDFVGALEKSLRLDPAIAWGHEIARSTWRQANGLAVLKGLGVVIVPGLIIDALVALILCRLARFCARKAVPRPDEYLSAPGANGRPHPHYPLRLSLRGWYRRCGYALLRFLLMLVPLAAFVLFVLLALGSGLVANQAAHLAITGFTNAYIFARIVLDIVRLLLAPHAPALRLIRIPSRYARWAMRRAIILITTIVVSYCLISAAEILGLADAGAAVLGRLAGLLVHVELAIWVCQSRLVVGRWIAGKTPSAGTFGVIRQRFAKTWYIFALFYLIGLWVAWAGGVHDALAVVLRAVLVLLAVLVTARLAWIGCNRLLKRLFAEQEAEAKSEVLALRERFKGYSPLIRLVLRAFILLLAVVLVLQGWGISALGWVLVNPIGHALFSTVVNILLTVTGAIMVWEICNHLLERWVNRLHGAGRSRDASRLQTLIPMLRAALAVIVVMLALIIGLSRIGVNTTGLLAVSSVVGIAVGFGSQKLVQDVITGLFLLFEDAVQVGDSVTLGGISGTVERLSIRTIRLRGGDGSVNIIPFSSVSIVTNQTRDFSVAQISIMVGYKENITKIVALLQEIGATLRQDPRWEAMIRDDLQIFGLDEFGELGLVITAQIRTGPGQHPAVRREFYARVQKSFLEAGIELPYRHQTLQLEIPPGKAES